MYDRRIRFTIIHEIGHIFLGHTKHSDLAESEADFFARYSLAPPPIIHEYKPEDYYEPANIFQIILECAAFLRGYNAMLERIEPIAIICFATPFPEMQGNIIHVDYQSS